MDRGRLLSKARLVVVKVGTSSITERLALSRQKVAAVACQVAALRAEGRDVILVSSGAIAAGLTRLKLNARPREMGMLQACAAVGQGELMAAYSEAFAAHGIPVAQILLTREDLQSRGRYLRIRHVLSTLVKAGVVPVVNENDTVAVEEIRFGDNDTLSALVASNAGADLLVLMSSMDGLYTDDPARSTKAVKIGVVDRISDEISGLSGKSRQGGVGGISAKVRAGRVMMECGIPMAIVDSKMPGVLSRLLAGEPVGTVFVPKMRIDNKLQWMLFSSAARGVVHVDEGAAKALSSGKASLLPSGVISVKGIFRRGDLVSIRFEASEVGRGVSNLGSEELESVAGLQTAQARKILGTGAPKEVVHHDNLVLSGGEKARTA